MFATRIPDISNTDIAACSESCYIAFKKLFESSQNRPEQGSLPFRAQDSDPHWKAYRTYTDRLGYIPADIKPGKYQIAAVNYAVNRLEDSEDKIFLISCIKLSKAFAKNVCQCFESNEFEKLNKLIEQERKKQTTPQQTDDIQTVMVVGFDKQEME